MTAGKRCGEQPLQAGAGGSKGQDSKKEKKEKKKSLPYGLPREVGRIENTFRCCWRVWEEFIVGT